MLLLKFANLNGHLDTTRRCELLRCQPSHLYVSQKINDTKVTI
jgi:hypothetical protein